MIHPDDVAAWVAQVRQQPEAAPGIIEALAARLIELDRQNEALRDELLRLRQGGETTADEGRVAQLARRVQALERQLERGTEVSAALLILTLDGRGARLPLPSAAAWLQSDDRGLVAGHLRPRHLLIAAEGDELLLLSDKGRAMRLSVADVGPAEAPLHYLSLLPGLVLDLDESLSVIAPLPSNFNRMTLVTRKGYARSFLRAEVDSLLERGLPLHSSPVEGDYPAFLLFSDGEGDLLVVAQGGKGLRFPERVIGVQARPAIRLERGEVVAGAVVVNDRVQVALVGADGLAARREMASFAAHPTAGHRGKTVTRIEDLLAVTQVDEDDTLWLLTAAGQMHAVPVAQVPSGPGASSGKVVLRLGGDHLVALAVNKGT